MMLYIKLIRFNNWIKNLFIFIPIFFAATIFESDNFINTLIAFFAFSIITSFVYIVNDIFDIEFDKQHLEKRKRPIPSGKISIKKSIVIAIFLLFIGLSVMYQISFNAFALSIIYVALNFVYSLKLKHIPIIDFIIVSLGFVIRILIGGDIGSVHLTQWIILLVFLLSLFISVTKRRDDVFQYENEQKMNRKVVDKYSVEFMDKSITIISSVLIVTYLLFITSNDVIERYQSPMLFLTFLPVLIGLLRYNQITYVYNRSGSPLKILYNDLFLQIVILSWLLMFGVIIYF